MGRLRESRPNPAALRGYWPLVRGGNIKLYAMVEKMPRKKITLASEIVEELKKRASESGESPSEVLRKAIESTSVSAEAFTLATINLSWSREMEDRIQALSDQVAAQGHRAPPKNKVLEVILADYLRR